MLDYSERGIWSVHVAGITPAQTTAGEGASASVRITLEAHENPKSPGPTIDLGFGFPASNEQSLRELQREAIAVAHALIARLAQETPETLQAVATKPRAKVLLDE